MAATFFPSSFKYNSSRFDNCLRGLKSPILFSSKISSLKFLSFDTNSIFVMLQLANASSSRFSSSLKGVQSEIGFPLRSKRFKLFKYLNEEISSILFERISILSN